MVGSSEVGDFSRNSDEDFCLIACMASTTGSSIWYIDNGASCHMTGQKRFFRSLQESGVNLHIELGNDAHYHAQGVGTVLFQRESGKPLSFADILYVTGLIKNLIYDSTLEDKCFHVKFRDWKVYIRPKGSDMSLDRVIGIKSGKVYILHFEYAKALVSNNSQGEL